MSTTLETLPEKKESLWHVILSPMIWAVHFMASYVSAAIWCEKFAPRHGTLAPARWAIALYTVVALAGIALNGWNGWRKHRLKGGEVPHDADTPEDRHRFLGFATFLLAGISAVATVYAALVVVFVEDCR